MFSEVKNFPSSVSWTEPTNLTQIGADPQPPTFYAPPDVSGSDRFRYFRRPLVPYLPSFVYAKRDNSLTNAMGNKVATKNDSKVDGKEEVYSVQAKFDGLQMRTIGVQSIFRYIR